MALVMGPSRLCEELASVHPVAESLLIVETPGAETSPPSL